MSDFFETIYSKTYQRTDLTTNDKRMAITLLGALVILPCVVFLVLPLLK